MSKRTLFRTDHRQFNDGDEMTSAGDHYDGLTDDEKKAEDEVRAFKGGHTIRADSLYAYESEDLASKHWQTSKGDRHLYELEVDEADIVHSGNLDTFSEVVTALRKKEDTIPAVEKYWSKEPIGVRTEHLVKKATVVKRVKDGKDWKPGIRLAEQKLRDTDENKAFYDEMFNPGKPK